MFNPKIREAKMAEWFETKVKFLRQMDNGLVKSITEQYLVDSMSFTEAEGRVMTEVGEGMREVTVVSIKRSSIKETVMYGETDMFFKVKVSYTALDEVTEKEKKINTYLLVNANDAKEAYERTEEHLKEMLVPFTITQISESPIIEVYQYQKGLRPGLRKITKETGATVQIADGEGNGARLNGDGVVEKMSGEFEMEDQQPTISTIKSLGAWFYPKVAESELWNIVKCAHKYGFGEFQQMMDIALFNGENQENHRKIYAEARQIPLPENIVDCAYTKQEQVGLETPNNDTPSPKMPTEPIQPKPDYPVWLANQIQEAFGWTLDVLQIRHIIEQHDTLPMVEFCRWIEMAYGASDKKIQACLTALKQPRQ